MDQHTREFINRFKADHPNYRSLTSDDMRNLSDVELYNIRVMFTEDAAEGIDEILPTGMTYGQFQISALAAAASAGDITASYQAETIVSIQQAEMFLRVLPNVTDNAIIVQAGRLARDARENPAAAETFYRYIEANGGTRADALAFQQVMTLVDSNQNRTMNVNLPTIELGGDGVSVNNLLARRGGTSVPTSIDLGDLTLWGYIEQSVLRGVEPWHSILPADTMLIPREVLTQMMGKDIVTEYRDAYVALGVPEPQANARALQMYIGAFSVPMTDGRMVDLGFTAGAMPELRRDGVLSAPRLPGTPQEISRGLTPILEDAARPGQSTTYDNLDQWGAAFIAARMLSFGNFDVPNSPNITLENLGDLVPAARVNRAANDNDVAPAVVRTAGGSL